MSEESLMKMRNRAFDVWYDKAIRQTVSRSPKTFCREAFHAGWKAAQSDEAFPEARFEVQWYDPLAPMPHCEKTWFESRNDCYKYFEGFQGGIVFRIFDHDTGHVITGETAGPVTKLVFDPRPRKWI